MESSGPIVSLEVVLIQNIVTFQNNATLIFISSLIMCINKHMHQLPVFTCVRMDDAVNKYCI